VIVEAESLSVLRSRTSEKWTAYPADVLPLFVAEMDYPLAEPIKHALVALVQANDLGYVGPIDRASTALASFAAARLGWTVDPTRVRTTTDVSVGIVETLRMAIRPGDGVVITPPIYPPFFDLVPEAGGVVVEVPLIPAGLDLDGIGRALAAGARAVLISNPHNPLGLVHSASSLTELAALAARYDAVVVSDEIHAPLTFTAGAFTPFLEVSDEAREHGIVVTSASKTFNLAGAKCAFMVAASERMLALLDAMPEEVSFRTSQLGLHAAVAAFDHGRDWLDGTLAALATSRDLLGSLLAASLPAVTWIRPEASYLAWLDVRELGWGGDPSIRALAAGVALNAGHTFGSPGVGHLRLNFACSPEVLTEAVRRLAAAC
jgi:cystathionine beta-lyase